MSSDEKIGIIISIFALFCIAFYVAAALTVKKVVYKNLKVAPSGTTGSASKNKYVWAALLDAILVYGVSTFITSYLATRIDSSSSDVVRKLVTQPYNFVFMYALFKSLYYGIKVSPATHVFFKRQLTALDIKNFLLLDLVMVIIVIIFY